MKRFLPSLGLLFAVLATSVTGYGQCDYTLMLEDTYGDGWNGNTIDVRIDGVTTNYTLDDGSDTLITLAVMNGDSLRFSFNRSGSWIDETSFMVYDADNTQIYSSGTDPAAGVHLDTAAVCPTCLPVTGVQVSNVQVTGIDVQWSGTSGAYIVEWGTPGFTTPTGTANTVTASYNITGLSAGTQYEVRVIQDCSGSSNGLSSPSMGILFATAVLPPWMESFDSGYNSAGLDEATGALTDSTTFTGTSSFWTADDYGNVTSPANPSAKVNIYGTSYPNEWFFTPSIDLGTGMGYQLEYDAAWLEWNSSTLDAVIGVDDTVHVVISTDNGVTWSRSNILMSYHLGNPIGLAGVHEVIDLTAYSGIVRFGFYSTSTVSNEDTDFFVDNIQVRQPPSCVEPSSFTPLSVAEDSVWFTFSADTTSSTYNVEWGPCGYTQGGAGQLGSVVANNDTTSISGLSPITCYHIYIQTVCSSGNSTWSGPYSVTTSCPAVFTAPYTEDFDGLSSYGAAPSSTLAFENCWTTDRSSTPRWETEDASGINENSVGTGPLYDNTNFGISGGGYIYMENGTSVNEANLYSPLIDLGSLTTPALEFYYHMYGAAMGELHVDVWNGTSWDESIYSVVGQQQTAGGDPWLLASVPLAAYMGDTIQVRFRGIRGTSFTDDISLDDISIINGPVCSQMIAGGSASGMTTNSADISWNAFGTTFDVEWGVCGFTPGMGTTITGTTAPHSLSGLSPNTCYEFYVTSACDVTSTQYGPFTFTTPCLASMSGTYTVNGTAGPNNFTTLLEAVEALECGVGGPVTIEINGTHTQSIEFLNAITGASATNTITFTGANPGRVDSIIASASQAAIMLKNTGNLVFSNLTLVAGSANFVVHMNNGVDNVTIDDCLTVGDQTLTSTNYANIVASGSETSSTSSGDNASHVTIKNSTISGGYYGVSIYGPSTSNRNFGVLIEDNVFDNQYFYPVRILYMDTVSVIRNTISGQRSSTAYAIYMSNVDAFSVEQNNVWAQGTYELYFASVGSSGSIHNSITNNMASGDATYPIYFSGSSGVGIYHNSTRGSTYGIYVLGTITDLDIRNNIFVGGSNYAAYVTSTSVTNVILDYNVYHTETGSNIARFGGTSDVYTDLAAWQTALPAYNTNSLQGDPIYQSTTNLDVVGTLPNDAGDNSVGVAVDIYGTPRPISGSTTVDIGAHEFNPPSCPPISMIGVISLSDIDADLYFVPDSANTSGDYNVAYGPSAVATTPQTAATWFNTTSDTINLSGLMAQTEYALWVRDSCGAGNVGPWSGPFLFTTACPAVFTAPYSEDFDGLSSYGAAPSSTLAFENCWTTDRSSIPRWETEDASGSNENSTGTGPFYDNTSFGTPGGGYIYMENGTSVDEANLFSPFIDLSSLTTPTLEFYYHMFGAAMGELHVDIWNGTGWDVSVYSIIGQQQTAGSDPWLMASVPLAAYIGDTVQVRFRGIRGTSFTDDISLDDISIVNGPACSQVAGGIASNITTTSADLSWNAYGTTYDIEWGTCGFTPGMGTTVTGVTAPYSLSGLLPATCYEFYVTNTCDTSGTQFGPYSFATACLAPMSGVYTVGGTAGPSNFPTLGEAVDALSCGISGPVTIQINGKHVQSIELLDTIPGSSAVNTVTFEGANPGRVDTVAASLQLSTVVLKKVGNLVFSNLTLIADSANYVVHMNTGVNNITIDDCNSIGDQASTSTAFSNIVASNSETSGISAGDNASQVTITNSTINGGYYGVSIYGTSSTNRNFGVVVENNVFDNQYFYPLRVLYMDTVGVVGNTISGQRGSTAYATYMSSVDAFVIEQNKVWAQGTYGMYFTSVGSSGSVHNSLTNNMSSGDATYPIYLSGVSGIGIYHNSTRGSTYGIYVLGTIADLDIRNNIFVGGSNYAFYSTSTSVTNVTLDYNLYHTETGSNLARFGGTSDVYADLAAWQASQSGYNQYSVEGDPVYTSSVDLIPLTGLANDAGDNTVGVTVDLFGNPRPATGSTVVDMGCVEYTPKSDDITVIALLEPTNGGCGDSLTVVSVLIKNLGVMAQTGFDVGVDITGAGTASLTTTYTATLNPFEEDTVVIGQFNSTVGGIFSLSAYVDLTGDEDTSNDTIVETREFDRTAAPDIFATLDTVCVNGNTMIWVENSNGVFWSNANGDTLAFGDTLHVSGLMTTDTFTARTTAQNQTYSVGPIDNSIGAASNFTGLSAQNLLIDVKNPIMIDSVTVHPQTGGILDIELKDASNNVLQFVTVNVPAPSSAGAAVRIPVGMFIATPGSYRLGGNNTNNAGGLYRNSSGGSYPYTSPSLDITGNTFDPAYYYYWYNIKYSTASCLMDDAVKVIEVLNPSPVSASFTSNVQPAPSMTVDFDASASQNGDTYVWDFGDGTVDTVATPLTSHAYASGGDYTVTLIVSESDCGLADTVSGVVAGVRVDEYGYDINSKVFPNPSSGVFNVTFELQGAEESYLRVINTLGQVVSDEYLGDISSFNGTIDLSDMPKGMYILQLRAGQAVASYRLSVY